MSHNNPIKGTEERTIRVLKEIEKPRIIKGNDKYQFITGTFGMVRKDCFEELIYACTTIGNCIFNPPGCGFTVNGIDYVPADLLEIPEDIEHAFDVLNAYFHPTFNEVLDGCMSKDKEE